tara:strand:- start:478 stop:870 length:393 start_codon:yes stop_codon:yes gene_type:complete
MSNKQAVLGSGARFKGKISNANSIEINGFVEADLVTEKVTIGSAGKFIGAVDSDLVVIAGEYEGKMQAESVWLTETSRISGEVHYKSLQMDRGAALNCRVVHNWNETDNQKAEEIEEQADEATEEQIDEK